MSAPDQTTVSVSSAVWTHWVATDVPATQDMSWQLTNGAVKVSVEPYSSHLLPTNIRGAKLFSLILCSTSVRQMDERRNTVDVFFLVGTWCVIFSLLPLEGSAPLLQLLKETESSTNCCVLFSSTSSCLRWIHHQAEWFHHHPWLA